MSATVSQVCPPLWCSAALAPASVTSALTTRAEEPPAGADPPPKGVDSAPIATPAASSARTGERQRGAQGKAPASRVARARGGARPSRGRAREERVACWAASLRTTAITRRLACAGAGTCLTVVGRCSTAGASAARSSLHSAHERACSTNIRLWRSSSSPSR